MSASATPPPAARLVLATDRRRVAPLEAAQPLTIGRAAGNRLCLASAQGVSDHHAVVRYSRSQGWVVCDWQSQDGTWLEGQRVRQCRPLDDGDEIRLGRGGPVLVFELVRSPGTSRPESLRSVPPHQASSHADGLRSRADGLGSPAPKAVGQQPTIPPRRASGARLDFEGRSLEVASIRAAVVRSEPQHPHIFSWWLLLCLGGLLLLPFPLLFWPLQITALLGWILLGSRKDHTLVVELRDGRALRHVFANRRTALAHRNGIRKAIGQGAEPA